MTLFVLCLLTCCRLFFRCYWRFHFRLCLNLLLRYLRQRWRGPWLTVPRRRVTLPPLMKLLFRPCCQRGESPSRRTRRTRGWLLLILTLLTVIRFSGYPRLSVKTLSGGRRKPRQRRVAQWLPRRTAQCGRNWVTRVTVLFQLFSFCRTRYVQRTFRVRRKLTCRQSGRTLNRLLGVVLVKTRRPQTQWKLICRVPFLSQTTFNWRVPV